MTFGFASQIKRHPIYWMPVTAGGDLHTIENRREGGGARASVRRSLLVCSAWTLAAFALPVGAILILGVWVAVDAGDKARRAEQETAQVREFLAQSRPAFADITADDYSAGWVVVRGTVATREEYDRLLAGLTSLFGPGHARMISRGISIRPAAADRSPAGNTDSARLTGPVPTTPPRE